MSSGKPHHDTAWKIESSRSFDGDLNVSLSGEVGFVNVDAVRKRLHTISSDIPAGKTVILDLENVHTLDSGLAGMLIRLERDLRESELSLKIAKLDATTKQFLALVDLEKVRAIPPPPERKKDPFTALGEFIIQEGKDLNELISYIGKVTNSLIWSLFHPGKVRWGEVFVLIQRTGSEALPIVALMSGLVGLVIAFSSAVQLRQFGANIFIANMIGIGVTRELGPLIAAILLTGRSGSAFAAEIGTMKISDEVDALTVMGVPPLDYLILPRILAVMLTLPLLTLFADVFGIIGGLVIGILSLDLTPTAFIQQLQKSIGAWDVFSGVIKSFFFGILVAGVGCYRGIETKGGALGVGISTTASVVSGIFLIILADSLFVVIFHYTGIG